MESVLRSLFAECFSYLYDSSFLVGVSIIMFSPHLLGTYSKKTRKVAVTGCRRITSGNSDLPRHMEDTDAECHSDTNVQSYGCQQWQNIEQDNVGQVEVNVFFARQTIVAVLHLGMTWIRAGLSQEEPRARVHHSE